MRILGVLSVAVVAGSSAAEEEFDRRSASDENLRTGPAIGERIPPFSGVDQNGQRRTFDTLKGENGALILFYRSADW